MAAHPDAGLTAPAVTAGLPPVATLWSKGEFIWLQELPENGGFWALSHRARMVCRQTQAPSPDEEMPPGRLQEFPWQMFFSDPTKWWDNKPRPVREEPGPFESVSTSIQVSSARLATHDPDLGLRVCRKLCEDGEITDAVDALSLLVQRGCNVPSSFFYRVLKRSFSQKDLVLGRRIHALSVTGGYEGHPFLATHLIGLYASHGRLEEAMGVFIKVSVPDAYNWAALIFAYARHGEPALAIRLYRQMRVSTVKPDSTIFLAVLKACATAGDLAAGKDVHAHILASAGKSDMFVQACLVDMYAKCGSLEDARRVFDTLSEKDVVTWTTMIAGYAQQGMGQEALGLYTSMQQEGITPPDSVTLTCLLQACASVGIGALHQGKQLHSQVEGRGLQGNVVVGASLMNMYAKCGSMEDARRVFDKLPHQNVVTWTAMIAGYAQQGMAQEALSLYSSMQEHGISPPDSVTFVCLLQACLGVGLAALHHGKQLHAHIEKRGLQDDVVVGASLVNMYAKCGSLEDARRVFERLPGRNMVTWTAMIAGYAQQGMGQASLDLYRSMQQENTAPPDSVTFACLLQACASVGEAALYQGQQLHAQIEERGLQEDVVLGGSLVTMYSKCSSIDHARRVFDRLPHRNLVAWNAMLAGYAEQGFGQQALALYSNMQQKGITPDSATFVCLLQACLSVGVVALHQGKQLHLQIEELALQDHVVVGASLVNMYAKCGSLEDARRVFDRLFHRNVVTWNAMIAGYVQQGMGQEALCLYRDMLQEGVTVPDSGTFVCLLQGCASLAVLPVGKQLHLQIKQQGLQADQVLGVGLVNMYAKCGSMLDSQQVFDTLSGRNIEAWNALISGYVRQGDSEVVFDLLGRMRLDGIQPDAVTFLNVMTLCSHVGLVDKGREYFEAMTTVYEITPTIEHYVCMMDLLGRAGFLDEALGVAKNMPFQPNAAVWRTLLGACCKWSDVEVGRQAFEFAVSLDEEDASFYVLMSNIYAGSQMWEEAKEMQARRVNSKAWKQPGQSWWTDIAGVGHRFVVKDSKHPDREGIYPSTSIQTEGRKASALVAENAG